MSRRYQGQSHSMVILCFTFYRQVGGGSSTERHSCFIKLLRARWYFIPKKKKTFSPRMSAGPIGLLLSIIICLVVQTYKLQ